MYVTVQCSVLDCYILRVSSVGCICFVRCAPAVKGTAHNRAHAVITSLDLHPAMCAQGTAFMTSVSNFLKAWLQSKVRLNLL